jgi:hypothetical protein
MLSMFSGTYPYEYCQKEHTFLHIQIFKSQTVQCLTQHIYYLVQDNPWALAFDESEENILALEA